MVLDGGRIFRNVRILATSKGLLLLLFLVVIAVSISVLLIVAMILYFNIVPYIHTIMPIFTYVEQLPKFQVDFFWPFLLK